MKYRGFEIRARQTRCDFGNWFGFIIDKKGNIHTLNTAGDSFIETRKELYWAAKQKIDSLLSPKQEERQ